MVPKTYRTVQGAREDRCTARPFAKDPSCGRNDGASVGKRCSMGRGDGVMVLLVLQGRWYGLEDGILSFVMGRITILFTSNSFAHRHLQNAISFSDGCYGSSAVPQSRPSRDLMSEAWGARAYPHRSLPPCSYENLSPLRVMRRKEGNRMGHDVQQLGRWVTEDILGTWMDRLEEECRTELLDTRIKETSDVSYGCRLVFCLPVAVADLVLRLIVRLEEYGLRIRL
ncbi:uncharacterized protein EV420DRAFT_1704960 [Desarmillaria tabescens]|uniref:Uncharacterized protein n=1 Tax=Armillaria tabescens TaxID=1929756 RepID=A0AA39MYF8_ARMTA|nr:uncharacterized protein EV420DRAFT_1704960 [Desarmillaria tabescens]KAK0450485.1 hypothetical protein EV420DRAFT_1704960 [Desarmillaria tabescens]